MPQDDKRAKFEFWAPLVFYLFAWIEFFMTIPRPWTPLEKQNTPYQIEFIAKPAATNTRGKAGAIMALIAWFVICASLQHSIRHYRRRPPVKLMLAIGILAIRVGYGIAAAWLWDLTIFRQDVQIGWPFGLGYGSILLIMIVFEVAGMREENEDRKLIKQRIARGRVADAELNIVQKPSWWDRHMMSRYASDEQRLRDMTREVGGGNPRGNEGGGGGGAGDDDVGGGRSTTRAASGSGVVEMVDMNLRNRSTSRPPNDPFRDESPARGRQVEGGGGGGGGVGGGRSLTSERASVSSERTDFTGMTAVNNPFGGGGGGGGGGNGGNDGGAQGQRIRSMLDV